MSGHRLWARRIFFTSEKRKFHRDESRREKVWKIKKTSVLNKPGKLSLRMKIFSIYSKLAANVSGYISKCQSAAKKKSLWIIHPTCNRFSDKRGVFGDRCAPGRGKLGVRKTTETLSRANYTCTLSSLNFYSSPKRAPSFYCPSLRALIEP